VLLDQDKKPMNAVTDWETEIGVIAGPFLPTDTKESWLSRAHKEIAKINPKVSFRHVVSLFYGHVRDPRYSVAASVLSAAELARVEAARREARQLADKYRSAANALANQDADFYRGHIDALVSAARILGAVDRARTEGADR
jgi:hypothetical protein